jgi:uncharacterized membrane protein
MSSACGWAKEEKVVLDKVFVQRFDGHGACFLRSNIPKKKFNLAQ